MATYLLELPYEIICAILNSLELATLSILCQTCSLLNELVSTYGWQEYSKRHPRPSFSLTKIRRQWSPGLVLRYDILSDRAWTKHVLMARPLADPWHGKLQPSMAMNSSYLVVAAGSNLHCYRFGDSTPAIIFDNTQSLSGPGRDITSTVFIQEDGDSTLFAGFLDGTVQHVELSATAHRDLFPDIVSDVSRIHHGQAIESLTSERRGLVSLSSNGTAAFTNLSDGSSSVVNLQRRSWVSYLSPDSTFVAFGTTGASPLVIHSITNDQLSSGPTAVLGTLDTVLNSAVYGVTRSPLSSPWGASPQIIVAGWYDGHVRCYDLRDSTRMMGESAPLRPVMTFSNPWSFEPIYAVSCGGGGSSIIAAGASQGALVSLFDVRSPASGWSIYAPGNDPSPIYALALESSRLFGATQSRPFVLDFGPGTSPELYPPLARSSSNPSLRPKKGGFYITTYQHPVVA
ncbi:hypothetical protein C8J56DRAFT_911315 [Mycena floridula]|nr:hypothetical protein C8J56DRAFT_911315 [Mycena floridula]